MPNRIGPFSVLLFLNLLILSACNTGGEYASNDDEYVDVNAWFKQQLDSLEKFDLQKSSTWNGLESPDSVYHPDWKKELEPFSGIPLNPASWKSDYHPEQHANGAHESYSYSANSSTNRLRRFSLVFVQGKLSEVELWYETSNLLKNANKQLTFRAGNGYEISGFQKTRFFPEEKYEIRGTFVAQAVETGS